MPQQTHAMSVPPDKFHPPDKLHAAHATTDCLPTTVSCVRHVPADNSSMKTKTVVRHAKSARRLSTASVKHAPAMMFQTPTVMHAKPARTALWLMTITHDAIHVSPGLFITLQTTHATSVRTGKPPPPDRLHAVIVPPDVLPMTVWHVCHVMPDKFQITTARSVRNVPKELFITPVNIHAMSVRPGKPPPPELSLVLDVRTGKLLKMEFHAGHAMSVLSPTPITLNVMPARRGLFMMWEPTYARHVRWVKLPPPDRLHAMHARTDNS